MMGKQRLSSMFTSSVSKKPGGYRAKGSSAAADSIVDDVIAEFAPDENDREERRRDEEPRATLGFANPIADVLPTQIGRETPDPPGQGGPIDPLFDDVAGDAGFGTNEFGPFGGPR